jgi:chromate reductase
MGTQIDVCVLVGSLRKGSLSRMLADALILLAPASMDLAIVEIGHLPFYNQDIEDHPPVEWTTFRERVKATNAAFRDARIQPLSAAVLKNALDVGSRPYGSSIWDRKPGAVVSGSPGGIGGSGANHHLRQSLAFLNVPTMQQPEAYIGHADALFDENGNLMKDDTRKFLQGFMQALESWIETIRS